ncbi:ribonucleoprotein, chloroplast, putative [Entamoeba dispar SAW760]|uniref:Ribonucleoprotein, chloroplast, putative n=1 Tax=Entamoeba dispar (strain ATCC PRA-260 / SAW760) TaxID=370354 RepID=B0EEZ1_ENTDS|nr:ribonucleoprotein, chloroplast, putative [Entamoeba dispar SAW760]EDR26908.1 ribonucleoprotein, chloroplast, putative [Entamoeba dispar SAW760]|eukprot:EDR26908.1 ribonucleoprotein, chloroplast, putative [Entamoeba dispar SAW760]
MNRRLFVGNLEYQIKNFELKDFFERFGKVVDVVIMKKYDGSSKGFGYVEFDTEESAQKALREGNNEMLRGRNIRVDIATERKQHGHKERSRSRERNQHTFRTDVPFLFRDSFSRLKDLPIRRDFDYSRSYEPYSKESQNFDKERKQIYFSDQKYDRMGSDPLVRKRQVSHDLIYEPLERYRYEASLRSDGYMRRLDKHQEIYKRGREGSIQRDELYNSDGSRTKETSFGLSETVIFVRNLPFSMDSFELKQLFDPCHSIDASVVYDKDTNKSKGYGFVVFDNSSDQHIAIEQFNNYLVECRKIMVFKASLLQEERTKAMR